MTNTPSLNVLVAPLDWGIGHATRCVPVISEFLKQGCHVITASNGRSAEFLKKEFPHLKHLSLNSYNIKYTKSGKNLIFKMLIQIPAIVSAIIKEHYLLKKIVKENNISLVVSDNRYGLWHSKVYSVFMTHQLMIKMPKGFSFAESTIHRFIRCFINKFDECWVPDYQEVDNLSGDLSHKYSTGSNTFFIGPLSRFSYLENDSENTKKEFNILFLLSGPEPQRSIFETLIINQLKNSSIKAIVVKGVTEGFEETKLNEHVLMFSHLPTDKLAELIHKSEIVVSRSGYSSVMDLCVLKANAVLVPTPGQTEQEYLATYLVKIKMFYSLTQKNFNINLVVDLMRNQLSEKRIRSLKNKNLNKRIKNIIDSGYFLNKTLK